MAMRMLKIRWLKLCPRLQMCLCYAFPNFWQVRVNLTDSLFEFSSKQWKMSSLPAFCWASAATTPMLKPNTWSTKKQSTKSESTWMALSKRKRSLFLSPLMIWSQWYVYMCWFYHRVFSKWVSQDLAWSRQRRKSNLLHITAIQADRCSFWVSRCDYFNWLCEFRDLHVHVRSVGSDWFDSHLHQTSTSSRNSLSSLRVSVDML